MSQNVSLKRRRQQSIVWVVTAGLLSGCAPFQFVKDKSIMPPALVLPASAAQDGSGQGQKAKVPPELTVTTLPQPPKDQATQYAKTRDSREQGQLANAAASSSGEVAELNLQQVPLPTFVQLVYAEILKRNVNVDPAVLTRKELVTFRTGATQSSADLDQAVRLLLKSYGLAVIDAGGLLRIVPDNVQLGNLPEIRRTEVSPDTPLPLRPVYQMVDMKSVRQNDVANWLKTLFGDRVKIQEDLSRNALLLSGTPDNMQAALEAIRVLDQPLMNGRKSVALAPAYWSADDLARRLTEVLIAEGYAVAPLGQASMQGGVRYPIVLLPVVGVNSVYVFATSEAVLNHVVNWARNLDRPSERGIGKNFFTYQVKHKDAAELAKTLDQLLSGSKSRPATTTAATSGGSSAARLSSVVVDQSSNMLIFQTEPEDYSQLSALLQTLDRPAKGALIEVTVAELKVTGEDSSGIQWLYNRAIGGGEVASVGLTAGASTSSPFNFKILNGAGSLKLAINALAASNRATILSNPRVQARNGEQALIQVGNEVPIITSSVTTPTGGGIVPTTSTMQTIQYRTSGVILKVKPVIHSSDQIDLEVQQEVSSADKTETGVNSTPTFSTRRLETKLTLRNGSTVLMGGLITDNATRGNGGLPWLKDIPVLGALFGNQSVTSDRRELVILITPYILNDSHDAETMTEAFRKVLGPWAEAIKPVGPGAAPVRPEPGKKGSEEPATRNESPLPPALAPDLPASSQPRQ